METSQIVVLDTMNQTKVWLEPVVMVMVVTETRIPRSTVKNKRMRSSFVYSRKATSRPPVTW